MLRHLGLIKRSKKSIHKRARLHCRNGWAICRSEIEWLFPGSILELAFPRSDGATSFVIELLCANVGNSACAERRELIEAAAAITLSTRLLTGNSKRSVAVMMCVREGSLRHTAYRHWRLHSHVAIVLSITLRPVDETDARGRQTLVRLASQWLFVHPHLPYHSAVFSVDRAPFTVTLARVNCPICLPNFSP